MASDKVKTLRFALGPSPTAQASTLPTIPPPKRQRVDDNGMTPNVAVVQLVELIDELHQAEASEELHFGLFLWPCALVLAQYIAYYHTHRFAGCVVLEIGCGIALPGILAAVCGNVKKVWLSDRADSRNIQRNVDANIALNHVQDVASYLALDWGSLCLFNHMEMFRNVDWILAADCFYQSEHFENVMVTVAMIFRLNPSCRFLTAYHLRSINRTIAPLLHRYGMTASIVEKNTFMDVTDVPGAESVYLYEITLMQ